MNRISKHFTKSAFARRLTMSIVALAFGLAACATPGPVGLIEPPTYQGLARTYQASFNAVSDFDGFYIVPAGNHGSGQDISTLNFVDPPSSHRAWIVTANDSNNDSHNGYKPHRAYPTIQFQKTADGIYRTPCLITLYVWLDMKLINKAPGIDDWMSFATLTPDASDNWVRTVLVNIEHDGNIHLMHVPNQGQQTFTFYNPIAFPQQTWVRLDIYIDFSSSNGMAALWQDHTLVCEAIVNGGMGGFAQAHFGLYASAALSELSSLSGSSPGTVYNDALRIMEVTNRAAAEALVLTVWP
jgi:hypothetical protein